MRRLLTGATVVLLIAVCCLAEKESVQELMARAETAKPEERPALYIEIAERQLKAVRECFDASKDQDALAALKDVVNYSEKAQRAAISSQHKLKATEISLRKMAAKLRDIKRSLVFEDQAPVQAAADRLESLRTDLLAKMFGTGK